MKAPSIRVCRRAVAAMLALALSAPLAGTTSDELVERAADVPILMYHRIRALPDDAVSAPFARFSVHPRDFEAQMNWLVSRGYTAITLGQLADYLRCGEPLPERPVVITFDDGWHDQFRNALPVLKKLGLHAEFFVCPGLAGHEGYMPWDEIRALVSAGMGVNPHSLTHPRLDDLSPDLAEREIERSRAVLEDELNRPAPFFAYPFGDVTPALERQVEHAGFSLALGTQDGITQRTSERFELRRITVTYFDGVEGLEHRLAERDPGL